MGTTPNWSSQLGPGMVGYYPLDMLNPMIFYGWFLDHGYPTLTIP